MSGAVALVTGGSSDLGAAVSSRLLQAGAGVMLVGRNRDRLDASAASHEGGDRRWPILADLTDPAGRDRVAQAVERHGRLDVLVLGSGIYERSDDPAALQRQLDANLTAPYALLRAVLPYLLEARGQVVFINSTQGLGASPGLGQYAATQHAMRAVADSFRGEVNDAGVRVLTVYLGRTATERQRAIFALEGRPYAPELLIQPDDVARVILGVLELPRTTEVTEIRLRPMRKSY